MPKKDKSLHPKHNENIFTNILKDIFIGELPEILNKKPLTGVLDRSKKRQITMSINDIVAQCERFKIGATGDASVRIDQKDYRKGYNFFQKIYSSTSEDKVIDLEVELIEKFMKLQLDKIDNKKPVRANKLTTYEGRYYIYVVFVLNTQYV